MLQNCSRTGAKCNAESLTKTVFVIFFAPAALLFPLGHFTGYHRCDLDSLPSLYLLTHCISLSSRLTASFCTSEHTHMFLSRCVFVSVWRALVS